LVRIAARFNAQMRPFVSDLGYAKKTSNDKARRVLGWAPREPREAIVAAAASLVGRPG
jgi:nucleoside-diphosphate-sugar epimerase